MIIIPDKKKLTMKTGKALERIKRTRWIIAR